MEHLGVELPLKIGTRRSNLAVIQAESIRHRLQNIATDRACEIIAVHTLGDKNKTTALYDFRAKDMWTAELEAMLTSGELDVVVHSLKGTRSRMSVFFMKYSELIK